MVLVTVYVCPNCGDINETQIYYHEEIDCERDKIYPAYCCEKCHREVTMKKIDGVQCYEDMDDNEYRDWLNYEHGINRYGED